MKIGLLSDTHGWIHPKLYDFFSSVDEIWHAGDIGNAETADNLAAIKPLRAVYGNIDGSEIRSMFRKSLRFTTEGKVVYMTHIGGHPGHYDPIVRDSLLATPPGIFICGHSHIARVMFDKKGGFLYINPGAAGYAGFHKIMTAVRFQIDGGNIHDLELIELGERGHVRL
jgi:putative phosphoesterase